MTRYAALLRGINVGGNKKIAMADLRRLLAALGYSEPATLLQSGNAVFGSEETDPARLAAALEKGIASELGHEVGCLVLTAADLHRVIDANPMPDKAAENGSRYLVTFLSAPPEPERFADIDRDEYLPNTFAFGTREIYSWYPEGISATKLSELVGQKKRYAPGVVATARNWNTVTKLLALLES
ncbi:DUF1697 domain-containing protein [Longispora albida]|uniref:DUF1697 domain-containing protein n=1 Tax=Longispora albida TaxID=203523 RepID=UPI0003752322|nr:DUF1697 domain-containing protein [Longispora albida]